MTAADKCRKNGWVPGTRLVGDEGHGPDVIEITAIGIALVLAVTISENGAPSRDGEGCWDLDCRKWRKVK